MIYRIQSLILLGVAICMGLVLLFPIWSKTNPQTNEKAQLDAYYLIYQTEAAGNANENFEVQEKRVAYVIAILAFLACIVAFYEIFRHDSRLTQIKLGALNAVLMAGTLGACVYFSFQGEKMVDTGSQGTYDLGFILPGIALILNLLANRFIRRDEKLVRSVDRLR